MGIDEDQRLAALQHELVDREQGLRREVLRMHHHQHVDIGGNRVDVGAERLDLVELLQLLDHGIGSLGWPCIAAIMSPSSGRR